MPTNLVPVKPDTAPRIAGIVTRADLLTAGMSREKIATAIRRGSLLPVGRGVYVRDEVARAYRSMPGGEHRLRAAAALAVTGPDTVVSHTSAAQLFGLALLGTLPTDVTLTCRPERGWRGRAGIQFHAVALPAAHVTTRLQLPATTAARTVIDLARTLDFRAGVVVADSALHKKLTTKDELHEVIAAMPRWPGITRAATVVDFAEMLAESALESIARVVFRDIGLPAPQLQVWLGSPAGAVGRVDFYWKRYRTVVEVDGAMKYKDPLRAREQLRRDALLRAEGFEVVHLDWHDITENPNLCATLIRDAFRRGLASRARTAAAAAHP